MALSSPFPLISSNWVPVTEPLRGTQALQHTHPAYLTTVAGVKVGVAIINAGQHSSDLTSTLKAICIIFCSMLD